MFYHTFVLRSHPYWLYNLRLVIIEQILGMEKYISPVLVSIHELLVAMLQNVHSKQYY
jgi:hypothetical protein